MIRAGARHGEAEWIAAVPRTCICLWDWRQPNANWLQQASGWVRTHITDCPWHTHASR